MCDSTLFQSSRESPRYLLGLALHLCTASSRAYSLRRLKEPSVTLGTLQQKIVMKIADCRLQKMESVYRKECQCWGSGAGAFAAAFIQPRTTASTLLCNDDAEAWVRALQLVFKALISIRQSMRFDERSGSLSGSTTHS